MTYKFYDTCSLLLNTENLFSEKEPFFISSITLKELENIKNSINKDFDIRINARKILNFLDQNPTKYNICVFKQEMLNPIVENDLPINEDMKILATAIECSKNYPIIFITNDLSLKAIAAIFFDENQIDKIKEEEDDYNGYLEICMSDQEMTKFYLNQNSNLYNLLPNEYIIISNSDKEIVDILCWTGNDYRHLNYKNFNSKFFGDVKPLKGDVYQALFADSLLNNQITLVRGPAGSGKTFLSLAYLFNQMEKGKIDKIIVFCNTIATKNSAKLGFYPGTRDEKLLDSQIGNLLISKLGGRAIVEELIEEEQLVLLPLSDIRGYDTSGMNAGIYISEAQNMDISLMKLTLQRIGEDSICIIDGDCKTQVDSNEFAGLNNGMKRASKIFRGQDVYGEITLKNIHRSKIAEIAEKM